MSDRYQTPMPPRFVEDDSSTMWGWLAGAVVVVLLAFAVIGWLGQDDKATLQRKAEYRAFMQNCIPTQAEKRCDELYRWRKQ